MDTRSGVVLRAGVEQAFWTRGNIFGGHQVHTYGEGHCRRRVVFHHGLPPDSEFSITLIGGILQKFHQHALRHWHRRGAVRALS
jgi:hypothetical protein